MNLHLDKQIVLRHCPDCGAEFSVVRGSVYDNGDGIGLYLIALHGHSAYERVGHLAVAILESQSSPQMPLCAAMNVLASADQFGFVLVEWFESPWQGETYLGQQLTPEEVRASRHQSTIFHIAEHVVEDISEVQAYFT